MLWETEMVLDAVGMATYSCHDHKLLVKGDELSSVRFRFSMQVGSPLQASIYLNVSSLKWPQ